MELSWQQVLFRACFGAVSAMPVWRLGGAGGGKRRAVHPRKADNFRKIRQKHLLEKIYLGILMRLSLNFNAKRLKLSPIGLPAPKTWVEQVVESDNGGRYGNCNPLIKP